MLLLIRIRQPVLEHAIHQRLIPILSSGTQVGQVVRDLGHGFGAAGDHDGGGAGHDGLGAEDHGFEARGAHFVDGGADGGGGEAGAEGALTGGVLADTII